MASIPDLDLDVTLDCTIFKKDVDRLFRLVEHAKRVYAAGASLERAKRLLTMPMRVRIGTIRKARRPPRRR